MRGQKYTEIVDKLKVKKNAMIMLEELVNANDNEETHEIFRRNNEKEIPKKRLKMNYVMDKINDLEARGCKWGKEETRKMAME